MGAIEDIYEDLDADVSMEEFREAVEEKVDQMGGLADEESAAMLVAHEFDEDGGVVGEIAEIEPGMEDVEFTGKAVGVGDLKTFERDDDREEGRVVNVEVADESGSVRAAFWDRSAQEVADGEIEVGDVVRVKGRPQEGYSGVEVSVDNARVTEDVEVDVDLQDTYDVADLSLGLSDVDLQARLLDTDSVRTFDRDDGSEGRVANLVVGDETGRIRVTLWDDRADRAEELDPGVAVEVTDGYVRERDGDLELHVGDRGAVEVVDADVEYVPDATPIEELEIGDTADVAGVVRSTDDKRTFERDDGSQGQVRNVRVQDETGDIRVALWGEKAARELGPGDEVHLADVRIEDGWQDDIEAAANWRSTVTVLEAAGEGRDADVADSTDDRGLDAFATDGREASAGATDAGGAEEGSDGASAAATTAAPSTPEDGEPVEFTGTVVQAGDPVVLDDGEETVSVRTGADVTLGEEVTVRGTFRDGRVDAEELH
ncbi:MAG: single-stranded DNA binding protein [Halobacteriales archaeon]